MSTENNSGVEFEFLDGSLLRFFPSTSEEQAAAILRWTYQVAKTTHSNAEDPDMDSAPGRVPEITFPDLLALINAQKNGESGVLETRGFATDFCIRAIDSELFFGEISWHGNHWIICLKKDGPAY